jgi:hypothetical protein
VAHTCDPSYCGGRDQEGHGSKPAQANTLRGPISKIPNTKRAGGVAQSVGPEFKPQYHIKKKERKKTKKKKKYKKLVNPLWGIYLKA